MKIYKYSATGNLFIVLDNREGLLDAKNKGLWIKLCQEYQTDGVLLLEKSKTLDFKMRIINSDGGEVAMCGNGLRAITHFARFQAKISNQTRYEVETAKGAYQIDFLQNNYLKVKMTELYDVAKIKIDKLFKSEKSLYLNTGVPHCVFVCQNIDNIPINEIALPISKNSLFQEGVNVNFVEIIGPRSIKIRTFERGVFAETFSCGTGATAAAITMGKEFGWEGNLEVFTKGGPLQIILDKEFKDVYFCGKVEILLMDEIDA